ncbi:hypothetical protein E2542_SST17344 [Spatholobus suberectus]|nr:hypothetical protein E2542_SST17344 [Spatholobus suberectus]
MKLEAVGGGCKDHPNNKQLPGVCPSCLRDKLLKLYDNSNPTYLLPSPSYPQPFSSHVSCRHRRHSSTVTDSVSSMVSFNYELKKSNSIAFPSRSLPLDREVNGNNNRGREKRSIWSKLFKLTRKNTKEAFMHSRTTREGNSCIL